MAAIGVLAVASMTAGSADLGDGQFLGQDDAAARGGTLAPQVVLSGAVFRLNGKPGLEQLSWLSPSRWGLGASAAPTVNLNHVTPPPPGNTPDPVWQHSLHIWLLDMAMQLALTAVLAGLTWWRLHQASPGRRR